MQSIVARAVQRLLQHSLLAVTSLRSVQHEPRSSIRTASQSVPLNPFTVGDEKRLEAVRDVAAPPAPSPPEAANSQEPAWWDMPRERGYVHPKQREQVRFASSM